jgi:deoxyribodipyrimidine photo-lyase
MTTDSGGPTNSGADRTAPSVVWLRDDLRLADNPALDAAVRQGGPLLVLFLFDEQSRGVRPLGAASRWWLHHSLTSLAASLREHGAGLVLRSGAAGEVLPKLVADVGATAVFWNRRYGAAERAVDEDLAGHFAREGVQTFSFQANLLHEPWTLSTGAGQPYKVFTPFWRACQQLGEPRSPITLPAPFDSAVVQTEDLADWQLLPTTPDWAGGLAKEWTPGEAGAQARLADFLDRHAEGYATGRELPAVEATSRLSPHLRFGEISPFQVRAALQDQPSSAAEDLRVFRTELGWREFCWHLLYHNPDLASVNYRPEFDRFPWDADASQPSSPQQQAWRTGRTGFPLVDAGMRQLWETGWMHNRVRMVTASFLIKNLLVDWRQGEAWFWDTLVDADAANNPANWQWVAGSGADASPYFRIFNPVTQSRKFDADGTYLRRFLPELADVNAKDIHEPWKAGSPGNYPPATVDLAASRRRALDAYALLKEL